MSSNDIIYTFVTRFALFAKDRILRVLWRSINFVENFDFVIVEFSNLSGDVRECQQITTCVIRF